MKTDLSSRKSGYIYTETEVKSFEKLVEATASLNESIELIGDIDAALDEIISIQESLIGGNA